MPWLDDSLAVAYPEGTGSHAPTNSKQNVCHQVCSFKLKMHQKRFRPGLRGGPRWGVYDNPSDPPPYSLLTIFWLAVGDREGIQIDYNNLKTLMTKQ